MVLPLEETFLAGEGDDVLRIDAVVGVVQREGADPGLVRMGGNGPVRDADGHPHDALVHIHAVLDVRPLADEFHDPGLVLVGDGKGLSLGGIAVGAGQVHDDRDGLPGARGPLQGGVDDGAVVDAAAAVHQFLPASPGGLGDDELLLVHVPHRLPGVGHLVDFAEELPGIPVVDPEQGSVLPVRGGMVVEFAEEGVRVGRVSDEGGAVLAGSLGDDHVGAGISFEGRHKGEHGGKEEGEARFMHRIWVFVQLLLILPDCKFMKFYQGMKYLWTIAAALLLGGTALMAQNQVPQTPEQKEKQLLEFIDKEVKRLSDQLGLEYWQEFYVDSTLTHDYHALQEELDELQKAKVGNVDLYQSIQDKWMQQIEDSYKRFFNEDQWKKYWKATGQRNQKARDKRKAKAEKASAELKNEGK